MKRITDTMINVRIIILITNQIHQKKIKSWSSRDAKVVYNHINNMFVSLINNLYNVVITCKKKLIIQVVLLNL